MEAKELKKYALPLIFVIIVIFVTLIWLLRTTTVSTMYCGLCHFKEANLFKTSFVHNTKNSSCVSCHDLSPISLSKHFTSDPKIMNSKCEGCHKEIKERKEIKGKKIIKMDHKVHLDGVKASMKCLDCHSFLAHDSGSYATNRPTMAGCFTGECHPKEKDIKKCDYCHYVKFVFEKQSN